jgi:hypothetical protein
MKRCLDCDKIINWDGSIKYCRRHAAEREFNVMTGLDMDALPDGLPIEDFIDNNGFLDYDGISTW